ncbi:MAG: ABC transporter permease, partial [Lachnospiraceae bacterium]|nr:ABC transporter permease [Lachnospiraceae bacterium]
QMLANVGGNAEKIKYFTYFTLFDPDGLIAGESSAAARSLLLFAGAVVLYVLGILVFEKKDLYI